MYNQELSERLAVPPYAPDTNNNSPAEKSSSLHKGDKYSLRPRSRRNADDDDEVASNPKQKKKKSAPLSKYRRKTANARERSRMREINQAFETLRRAVPQITPSHPGANEKLTKITTLRLAMKYISTLSAVLSGAETPPEMMSDCSDLDCFLLESDGESVPLQSDLSDHSLTSGDFHVDFVDDEFSAFAPLSPDLTEHLTHFDTFLSDFS